MATFTIQAPDGRKIKVEANDEASALAGVQDYVAKNPIEAQPQSLTDQIGQKALAYRGVGQMQPGQQVEGNPTRSPLPGMLGDLQNTSSAFQANAGQGILANFGDELYAGLGAIPSAIGENMAGNGFDPGARFNAIRERVAGTEANQTALNPSAAGAGKATGGIILGSTLGKGGATMIPSVAASPLRLALAGSGEGALYGAAYGAGDGDSFSDRATKALQGGAMGALTGAIATPLVSGFFNPQVSRANQTLNTQLTRDNIDPTQVNAMVPQQFGPTGVVADLGPNLRGTAAAIATEPGQGQTTITNALTNRQQGANARIAADLDNSLGPAVDPSAVTTEIDAARKAVNTQYEPVFRAKALSNDPFIDVKPVVAALDNRIGTTVGQTQNTLRNVRDLLSDANGNALRDPQMVMAVRHELDGMIDSETNRTIQGALKDIRKALDNELGSAVPGLKAVDAQFQEVARQADSLERGQTILDSGRTAVRPTELDAQVAAATPGQQLRLSQGARAEIDRLIGTKGNDRVALNQLLKGEGSWNRQRLETVFGKPKADALLGIFEREAALAATENAGLAGSRTSPLISAKADLDAPSASRKALESFDFMRPGRAAINVADALLGGRDAARKAATNSAIADALMSQGLSPQSLQEIMSLRTAKGRPVIQALLAGAAAK